MIGRWIANNLSIVTIRHLARLPRPLATLVQAIVDVSSGSARVFAVECLTRGPRGSRLEEALPLFDYIRRRGLEREMDRLCVSQSLQSASACDCRITLNVHPTSLQDGFVPFLVEQSRRAGIDPSRVIVEIGEQSPAADANSFRRAIDGLRHHGVAIAIDDVGYGHSNLRAILESRPDYLKIDRYFVAGVDKDPAKVAAIRSIQSLAAFFDSRVIAEGVERPAELATLRRLGIDLFQGFLFSRPAAVSSDWSQHPVIDGVLQDNRAGEQALVESRIDVACEIEQPLQRVASEKKRPVKWFGFGALERVERKSPADEIAVE